MALGLTLMVLPKEHPGRARQRQQAIRVSGSGPSAPTGDIKPEANRMTHALQAWVDETRVATIEHEGRDDRWNLTYAEPWIVDARPSPTHPRLCLGAPGT